MDSLNSALNSAKEDTTRLRLYLALANDCEVEDNLKYGEPAIALIDKLLSGTSDEKEKRKLLTRKVYALDFILFYYQRKHDETKLIENTQKKLNICLQINDTINILNTYMSLGGFNRWQGNLPKALEHYQKGLITCEELNYKEGIARCQAELGDMYLDQGDTTQAIEIYKRMLSIVQEMKDKNILARSIMQAGGLYNAIGNHTKALEYYEKGRVLFEEMHDKGGLMEIYKNSGDTYNAKGDFEKALLNYKNALQLAEEMKKPIAVVNFMGRIAKVHSNMLDFKSAVEYINRAIQYNKEHIESGDMQVWLKSRLAGIYYKQKDFRKAKHYSDISLVTMKANGASTAMELEELAAKIDSACGNYKEAYFHYQQYILLRDKLNSEEVRKAATKEKFQGEYDKQKAVDKAEQDKKDIILKDEVQRQKIVRNSFIGGFILVLVLATVVFRSYRQKQKSNQQLAEKNVEIEEKNKDITDSIRYARRIQTSLLPTDKYINRVLAEKDKSPGA